MNVNVKKETIMEKTKFERFEFKPFIIEAIKELGFHEPTEIQERLIPSVLKGESAIGQSQTGTGKTHAYLLPILEKIDPKKQEVQAVITAPTRELATQIYQEVLKIAKHQCRRRRNFSTMFYWWNG